MEKEKTCVGVTAPLSLDGQGGSVERLNEPWGRKLLFYRCSTVRLVLLSVH
jgi:hypothetical protein